MTRTLPSSPHAGPYGKRLRASGWLAETALAAALLMAGAGASSANTLTVSDVALAELNAGTRNFTFNVTLDRSNCTGVVTVQYATADGGAIAPGDYAVRSGTLVFPAQQAGCVDQFQSFAVPVNGDETPEEHETFTVVLSNPVNATITDGTGIGTILNDESFVSVADTSVVEGQSASWMRFRVWLSHPSVLPLTVSCATVDGTAKHPADFGDTTGLISFSQGEMSHYVEIALVGDQDVEPDENFHLQLLNASGGVLGDASAIGTILDDDAVTAAGDPPLAGFALAPGAPNPMRGSQRLAYSLPRAGRVVLAIYTLQGRRVRTLEEGPRPPGMHAAVWNGLDDRGRALPSGVYFCRLDAGGESATRRLIKLN